MKVSEQPYTELFKKEQLVYLTADAENVIHEFDKDKVYIIGGIVDRNRLKGKTLEKANMQKIASAQLPLGEHVDMGTYCRVLTVNHVVDMVIEYQACKDWRQVCDKCVPGRKLRVAQDKDAEAGADGDADEDADADADPAPAMEAPPAVLATEAVPAAPAEEAAATREEAGSDAMAPAA